MNLGHIAKAILAGLIAFIGSLVTASLTGGIDLHEWLAAALAGLVALGGVYAVPNSSPRGTRRAHRARS